MLTYDLMNIHWSWFHHFSASQIAETAGQSPRIGNHVHPAARRGQQKWLLFHIGRFISIYETFYECSHPFTYTYTCHDVSVMYFVVDLRSTFNLSSLF